jgi:putative tryptophan/tyrosine transport system substrate-binding protein
MMPPREEPPMERHGSRLSRRVFVVGASAGLGLLAGCGRWPGQPLQPLQPKVHRIGVLAYEAPAASEAYVQDFRQGLRELGYDDQHLVLEFRGAEWQSERLPGLAAELVALNVDLILALAGDVARAAMEATTTIPIVFWISSEPVPSLVPSYARPGGNATGVTYVSSVLAGKRLDLLKQMLPAATRVAVLWQPTHLDTDFAETQVAAQALGVELLSLEVRRPDDIEPVLGTASAWKSDALIMVGSRLTGMYREQIMDLAARRRLPVVAQRKEDALAGSLLSYGPNQAESYRRAVYYVDRILKGTKPADLPIELPMRFDFVVNLKTAQALGITFPNEIMLQVTEVIQ